MTPSEEVKQRIDLVEIVSRYTSLKKAGSTYKGLCPFHSERTPSFVVFPHTNTWRCFGSCGEGGDVFTFIMKKENMEFREALECLASEAGVVLTDDSDAAGRSLRTQLQAVNELAAQFFRHSLTHHPAAQHARDYVTRRGIDATTAERFALGFAPNGWSALRDYLLEQGFSLDLLLTAGLVKRHEERDSTYDLFRNRLMIPIRDRQGRIIGFGGRILDDGQPKYLNTPDTPLFHKSRVIYGMDLAHAAIREAGRVVIVEGYMDVIAAHQHGYANVVACMGTALTVDQLQQLQRYTDDFVLALDADSAGEQATLRGLNQARQALTRVRKPVIMPGGGVRVAERLGANLFIAAIPAGLDPDDLIRREPDRWTTLVADAKPLVDFYLDLVGDQFDLTTARGKGQAVAELAPLIGELDDEIERQHYVQRLARMVQIDERTIESRVRAAVRTGQLPSRPEHRPAHSNAPVDDAPGAEFPRSAVAQPAVERAQRFAQEDHLLANLLHDPDMLIWLARMATEREVAPLVVGDLQNAENQEILRALQSFMAGDEPWDVEIFQESLNGYLHGRLAELVQYVAQLPERDRDLVRVELFKVLIRMRILRLKAENQNIRYLLDEAQRSADMESVRSYDSINNRNIRELAHLQRVLFAKSRHEAMVRIV